METLRYQGSDIKSKKDLLYLAFIKALFSILCPNMFQHHTAFLGKYDLIFFVTLLSVWLPREVIHITWCYIQLQHTRRML